MPNPELLQGDIQEVMAWVILAQVALYIVTCIFFIRKLNKWEDKHDKLQTKTYKQIARSNRAMEAVAELPPPKEDNDEEED